MKSQPICYLICGFLGSGKTTYSKKLAQEIGAIHLNPDEWCVKLFSKEECEQNWSECFSKTIDYLWRKASEYEKQGKSVVFDMGFWTKQSRHEAVEKSIKFGFSPVVHYVYAPDEIFVRIISRTYSQGGIKLLEVWRMRFFCLKPNFL